MDAHSFAGLHVRQTSVRRSRPTVDGSVGAMTRKVGLVLLMAVLTATGAGAQRLPVRSYTVSDGLADNTITRIVRDSRGFLWFCTPEGLSRFDGYAFTTFGTEQGLLASPTNLLETRRGDYFVGTYNGL